MPKKVTLADVARRAHVSVSTASKALNGSGRLSADTRRMVRQTAEEIGYRPHTSADSRNRRSGLVGLITSDRIGRFALPLLTGAEQALGASNHAVLLMSSNGSPELERRHIDLLASYGVDGLIVVDDSTNPRPPLDPRTTMGLPVVYAYAPSRRAADCSVVCDNVGAGSQAIEYLMSLGRRNIAVIGGEESFDACSQRIQGAMEAFALYGRKPLVVWTDVWSEEWGHQAAAMLLRYHPQVDAVYCLSDEIARGMVRGLTTQGRRIPQDVAVLGHDDWDVFSINAHPKLTTFDNNLGLIGRTAAKLLLDALRGEPHRGVTSVECSIIIRESTELR